MLSKMKNNKKIIFLILILLTVALSFVLINAYDKTPKPKNGYTKEQAESDRTKKNSVLDGGNSSNNSNNTGNNKGKISLNPRQEGANVVLLTRLDGYGSGKCNLTVSNGARNYTSEAEVIYQSEYSTCAGFTIPVEKLGTGKWLIGLSLDTGGITNSQSIELEVK